MDVVIEACHFYEFYKPLINPRKLFYLLQNQIEVVAIIFVNFEAHMNILYIEIEAHCRSENSRAHCMVI